MYSVRNSLTKSIALRAVIVRLTRPIVLFKSWVLWSLVVVVGIAVASGAPNDLMGTFALVISAAAGALASVILSIVFSALRVRSSLKPGDGILGDHLYELREDGLYEKTEINESLTAWAEIQGALSVREFIFIELRNGSFHPIPKQFFESMQSESDFVSRIALRANGIKGFC